MALDASLPRTPIEWYMLGLVLVVGSMFGLIVTGHTLPEAVAMGLVSGLVLALAIVIVVMVLQVISGEGASETD
ncbi:hypothetical protein ACLI4Z_11590 [Natrialbaceae archaeon A-arb3/5]